jgi:hypothetical protein
MARKVQTVLLQASRGLQQGQARRQRDHSGVYEILAEKVQKVQTALPVVVMVQTAQMVLLQASKELQQGRARRQRDHSGVYEILVFPVVQMVHLRGASELPVGIWARRHHETVQASSAVEGTLEIFQTTKTTN